LVCGAGAGSRHPTLESFCFPGAVKSAGGKPRRTLFGTQFKTWIPQPPIATGRPGPARLRRQPQGGHCARDSPTLAGAFFTGGASLASGAEISHSPTRLGFEAGVTQRPNGAGAITRAAVQNLTGTLRQHAPRLAQENYSASTPNRLNLPMAIAATQSAGMRQIAAPCANPFTPAKRHRAGCWLPFCRGAASNGSLEIMRAARLLPLLQ